jgi:hypothetical protein
VVDAGVVEVVFAGVADVVPVVVVTVVELVEEVLLQAPNTVAVASNSELIMMSHFLLNRFNNFFFSLSYFLHYMRLSLRIV